MSEPIVFMGHNQIKKGKLDDLTRVSGEVTTRLQAEKPRTLVFLAFVDEGGTRATFAHVFADAESMDLHFEGGGGTVHCGLRVPRPRRLGDLWQAQQGGHRSDATDGGIGWRHADRPAGVFGRPPSPQGGLKGRPGKPRASEEQAGDTLSA